MGFLGVGKPLSWSETSKVARRIKHDGLQQLLQIWRANRNAHKGDLKWGDEVEYTLVHLDVEHDKARIHLDGNEILEQLEELEKSGNWPGSDELARAAMLISGAKKPFLREVVWHPEFGRHMIEATPNPPYDFSVDSLLEIEDSMLSRRYKLQSILPPNVYATSLTAFPMLGLPDTYHSNRHPVAMLKAHPEDSAGKSVLVPDVYINPHPRFGTLVRNVTARRGVKSGMFMPVFQDKFTGQSDVWAHSLPENTTASRSEIAERSGITLNPVKGKAYMDHFGLGMGMCCLQMTYGTHTLAEARLLHDQMVPLAPIFLALSQSTPMHRGYLLDTDARWRILEQGCDDRTEDELRTLERTRYGAVSLYLGGESSDHLDYLRHHEAELNDVNVPIDQDAFAQLVAGGMDMHLARHFASLWIRDPLVVFSDRLELDNALSAEHFENIQSTNWNSVRFKPPPPSADGVSASSYPWRVELRSPDLQLSDFENAALAGISAILAMAIVEEGWNFYTPISMTHKNMNVAHERDAIREGLFWFRCRDIVPDGTEEQILRPLSTAMAQMSLREIFLGSQRTGFPGLLEMLDGFISKHWRNHKCSRDAVERYRIYANHIRMRVLGQIWSNATLLRHLVSAHPLYQNDSIISHAVNYDIAKFAIRAGFSLESYGSPWSPASSVRRMKHVMSDFIDQAAFATIANVPLVQSLLALPAGDCSAPQQPLAALLMPALAAAMPSRLRLPHRGTMSPAMLQAVKLAQQQDGLGVSGMDAKEEDEDVCLTPVSRTSSALVGARSDPDMKSYRENFRADASLPFTVPIATNSANPDFDRNLFLLNDQYSG